MIKVDKRDRAALFRTRLATAIALAGSSQSKLARDTGVDRSTLSQLLRDDGARLPNAQLVAACAAEKGTFARYQLFAIESIFNPS